MRIPCVGGWALVVLTILLGRDANAAAGIQFTNLSVEDGLSQTSVQAVIQDRQGFIWIATHEGLNRFDGRDFLQYFHDDMDGSTLAHNWVWALHEDRQGRIWVGTDGGGLDRLDPVTGVFTHFPHIAEDPATIGGSIVRDIVEDAGGYLWVGTDGGGLSRVDPHTDAVVRLEDLAAAATLSDKNVRVLHRDDDGSIWVGTDGGGVDRLDPVSGQVDALRFDGQPLRRVRALATQGTTLWVGTYEGGLVRFDRQTGEVTRFVNDPGDPASLAGNSIWALLVDEDGTLWVGSESAGLHRFDSAAEEFVRYQHEANDPSSLTDDHVLELAQDRGGVIWIGTYRGISRWNPRIGSFTTVTRKGDDPGQLSDNYITSLVQTQDGAIWVGTYGGGLNRWNDERTGFEHYTHDPWDPASIADDRVFALEPDGDTLWIGTRGGSLGAMNLSTRVVRRYVHDPEDAASLSADGVTTILRDSRGTVWVGTFVAGLNRLDNAETGRFTRFRHRPGDETSLCSDSVLDLIEDASGAIWIGTFGGGLCRLDTTSGTFSRVRHDPTDRGSLSSNRAWSLHEDAAGNLWIATQDAGLNLWRAEDRRAGRATFARYGRDQRLGDQGVYAAVSDSQGNVWFSTNRGLAKLDPESGSILRYDVSRGLQSNEFNHNARGKTARGELMFGGIAGFNIFEPERIRSNEHPPQIAFTGISRLNEPVDLRLLAADRRLEFTYRDQLVSFDYAALDFTSPSRNRYRHRLRGFDESWIDDGTIRRTTYTNLAPGAYTFEVTASNSDGLWAREPLRLPFTVLPAPWASWWAYLIYGVLTFAALALLVRSQARRIAVAAEIHRTNEALRSEMTRREAQQKALVKAKEQAQRYLDVVEVIILSLDEAGKIRLVNQKGLGTLGYRESQLIGQDFYDVLVPLAEREGLRQQFADIADHAYAESTVLARDGSERFIAWHVVALPADEDHPAGLLVSGMDQTQERSLERQVREAQKLEALGTLSRGIAHDFNNILSAILGFSEMMRRHITGRSQLAGYLDGLELSVERARGLISSILTFGRQSQQDAVPTLVQNLVAEVLHLLRPSVAPGTAVVAQCDERAPPVSADPTQLHQLVMNLATNALQAMGERGGTLTIAVSTRDVSREEARARSNLRPGRHVALEVEDTGPGMDAFTQTRMFEPFFTTKGPSGGTGLGLSVVHGLVTQMGGDIDVDSREGRGTRIVILLPACGEVAAPGPADAAEPSSDLAAPGEGERVMLVDDEPLLVALGTAILESLGYQVLGAGSGAEALELLQGDGPVDVIITDQNMPGMSGLELAAAVRGSHPGVPVILMSGAHDTGSNSSGVDAALAKPFKQRELARTIRLVLERRAAVAPVARPLPRT